MKRTLGKTGGKGHTLEELNSMYDMVKHTGGSEEQRRFGQNYCKSSHCDYDRKSKEAMTIGGANISVPHIIF